MDQTVPRTRLFGVAGAYAAVLAVSAALIFARWLTYATHPADAAAYSGMWAGGDLLLEIFIAGMLLAVTFFAVLAIFKYEGAYTSYSKILVVLSLTAPASVGFIAIPAVGQGSSGLGYVGYICLYRIFASPLVLIGLGMSRVFARFAKARRMTNWALLIEGLTLVLLVLALFLPLRLHRP
jgi:hypothetical protein